MKKQPQDPPENRPIKSMSFTKNLKDRLYEKGTGKHIAGFHQGTLPSVKRTIKTPLEALKSTAPVLAINLNSYKTRQQQAEVPILKQQSTVFQEGRLRRDSSRGLEAMATITHRPIQQRIEEEPPVP